MLCYGATERNGGLDEARRGLAESARFIASRQGRHGAVKGAVGLHAGFTVSDETLKEAGALCEQTGAPLHVHVAEDGADVSDAQARGYAGPYERLERLGAIKPGAILAHGVHLTPNQVAAVASAGAWLVQNPRSNEGNGVGYPAGLSCSSEVALGTDGWMSDMREEAMALSRLGAHEPDEVRAARQAAGHRLMAQCFGATMAPMIQGSLGDAVVTEGETVRHVIVDGQIVVRDGRLVYGDMDEIAAEARAAAAELWDAMAAVDEREKRNGAIGS